MAELDDRFAGLDRPRPLPRTLRSRLETTLAGSAAAAHDRPRIDALDRPRPLPAGLRRRLEDRLAPAAAAAPASAAGAAGPAGSRLGAPRGLPALAIAAVLLLLFGIAAVTNIDRDAGPVGVQSGGGEFGAGPRRATGAAESDQAGSAQTEPRAGTTAGTGAAAGGEAGGGSDGPEQAEGDAAAGAVPAPAVAAPLAARTSRSATVAVAHDDIHQYAGFLAYIDELNRRGDVHIDITAVRPHSPQDAADLTVNLSARPLTGPDGPDEGIVVPLLETLTVTEAQLTKGVYSFAPPIERVGHLAADELFPSPAPGTTAVIYYTTPYGDDAAAAIEDVLVRRQVAVVRAPSSGENVPSLVPADAAFVVLPPAQAQAWLAEATEADYRPPRGVAGLHTFLDERLLPDVGDDVTILSPYLLPDDDEAALIRDKIRTVSGGDQPAQLSGAAVHGWVTAKGVAEIVRRVLDGDAPDLTTALDELEGWDSGLAPPYAVRPGTRARTPEATVFRVRGGAYATDGAFLRDPHA